MWYHSSDISQTYGYMPIMSLKPRAHAQIPTSLPSKSNVGNFLKNLYMYSNFFRREIVNCSVYAPTSPDFSIVSVSLAEYARNLPHPLRLYQV